MRVFRPSLGGWAAVALLASPWIATAQGDVGPPPERAGEESVAERGEEGRGYEDTFGDTDAFDDEASEDSAAGAHEPERDSWGTGFKDDDHFGDTDAFDDDAFGDTEPLDRCPES